MRLVVLCALLLMPAPRARTVSVEMRGFEFRPAHVEVVVGDTVVWTNRDAVPHTATAQGAWDSGEVKAGSRYRLIARGAGEYEYVCAYHPSMKGRLTVRPK